MFFETRSLKLEKLALPFDIVWNNSYVINDVLRVKSIFCEMMQEVAKKSIKHY